MEASALRVRRDGEIPVFCIKLDQISIAPSGVRVGYRGLLPNSVEKSNCKYKCRVGICVACVPNWVFFLYKLHRSGFLTDKLQLRPFGACAFRLDYNTQCKEREGQE